LRTSKSLLHAKKGFQHILLRNGAKPNQT